MQHKEKIPKGENREQVEKIEKAKKVRGFPFFGGGFGDWIIRTT